VRLVARFDANSRTAARYLGRTEHVSAAKARSELIPRRNRRRTVIHRGHLSHQPLAL